MKYQKLTEFRYLRDISILIVSRSLKIPFRYILQMKKNESKVAILSNSSAFFQEYLSKLKQLFPDNDLLFPTDDGKPLLTVKYKQNLKRIIQIAGITGRNICLSELTSDDFEKLLDLKFAIQRPNIQVYLATALLGYLALRPNEVANIKKDDIFLSEEKIILRNTKSREDQPIVIYPTLVEPLKNYIQHLGPEEPLFIRESNEQWDRRDVYRAINNFGKFHGFTKINPRRFRSTVANYMINSGIPIKFVSKYLRHADIATTLRHYLAEAGMLETRIATKYLHVLRSGKSIPFNEFLAKETLN